LKVIKVKAYQYEQDAKDAENMANSYGFATLTHKSAGAHTLIRTNNKTGAEAIASALC
jgi:hypothetical protein